MKIKIVFILSLFVLIFVSFQSEPKPEAQLLNTYYDGISAYQNAFQEFERELKQKSSPKKLRKSFEKVRSSYKKIEYLLSYFDEGSSKYINAAPLPKVDVSNAQFITLDPAGLQVIEESLFEEKINYDELTKQSGLVNKMNSTILERKIVAAQFTAQNIYIAGHRGLIRCFIQGISGFDVPSSGRAIAETAMSLSSIQQGINVFGLSISQDKLQEFNLRIESAIRYIERHSRFETFNRFEFLKSYANPLLKAYVNLGQHWAAIDLNEIIRNKSSVNPYAENLFSPDFLNPLAFSSDPSDTLSEARLELGRYLFFDPILSNSNLRSCASCHKPELAFSDGYKKSLAFDSSETLGRNAPSLLNSAYQNAQFWDMREALLEDQIDHVLSNGKEFHSDYASLINKLNQSEEYDSLFAAAFGPKQSRIDIRHFNLALADYVRSLSSFDSPFDQMIRGEIEADPKVVKGFNLFMGKALCSTCHFPPTFSGLVPPDFAEVESEVIGVPSNADLDKPNYDTDLGRFHFQNADFFKGSFKTPGVRNLEKSAPYMHNGAFPDLKTVLEFYNRGGGQGIGLNIPNQTLPFDSLSLTNKEVDHLIYFLEALNETQKHFPPERLPAYKNKEIQSRKIGGEY